MSLRLVLGYRGRLYDGRRPVRGPLSLSLKPDDSAPAEIWPSCFRNGSRTGMRQEHTMVLFGWLLAACTSTTQIAPAQPKPVQAARAAPAQVDDEVVPAVVQRPMLFPHA